MKIDKSKPILVTGATGYVAGWIIKKLMDEGMNVHAGVRDPQNKRKIRHLDQLAKNSKGSITYFKSDLLQEGSYAEAMENCELVYHTASPFTSKIKDPQRDLIDPAVKGTINVLEQANKTNSVKRVVLTSSCAAIYSDSIDVQNTPNKILTEKEWNTNSSLNYLPYSYSKTLAEKKAWEIVKSQQRWDMVVINPSFVMGPALNTDVVTSDSFNLMIQMGEGTLKAGAPNIGVGIVDVRDLAIAHYNAGFFENANGRNIISGHNSSFLEIGKILDSKFGSNYALPKREIPKWLLMIVGPFVDKALSRKFIKRNVNYEFRVDNSKSKKELKMNYRPLEETLIDMFNDMVENKLV